MPKGVYARVASPWNKGKSFGGITKTEKNRRNRLRYASMTNAKQKQISRRNTNWWRTHQQAALLHRAKMRAKLAKLPFTLSLVDIHIPKRCPIFKMVLAPATIRGGKDNSPSLDRIKSHLGYVRGNVQVISSRANRAKSNLTPRELVQLAQFVIRKRR